MIENKIRLMKQNLEENVPNWWKKQQQFRIIQFFS